MKRFDLTDGVVTLQMPTADYDHLLFGLGMGLSVVGPESGLGLRTRG